MNQSLQNMLTSASAVRGSLHKLHRFVSDLAAREEKFLEEEKARLKSAYKVEEEEEMWSSDDEMGNASNAEAEDDGKPGRGVVITTSTADDSKKQRVTLSMKAELLHEFTTSSNVMGDLWRSIDPLFAAQVVVPTNVPPKGKEGNLLPLLTIAVAPSDSNCQYLPDESFTSSESKLSLEEDAAIRLKIAEHAEKMSAITTDMKRRMDSLILPRASNASGNTAEQQPEQKKSLRNFKRKLNA